MGWEKAASLPFRWRKFNLIEGNVLAERPLVGFHVATRTDAEPDSATSRINDKTLPKICDPSNSNRTLSPTAGVVLFDSMAALLFGDFGAAYDNPLSGCMRLSFSHHFIKNLLRYVHR